MLELLPSHTAAVSATWLPIHPGCRHRPPQSATATAAHAVAGVLLGGTSEAAGQLPFKTPQEELPVMRCRAQLALVT